MSKKTIITIILITIILYLSSCQKRAEIADGWVKGRYDLADNINYAEVDKICYDLGTPAARKILQAGWSKNIQSFDGRNYSKANQKSSIIELPPMTSTSRVLSFQAYPFVLNEVCSAYVALYFNGHFLKRVKLIPGWKTYSVPIKGRYFSFKKNILLFEHNFSFKNSKRPKRQQRMKPSVAYDKIYLTKKHLAKQEKNLMDNFIRLKQQMLNGDTRTILETRANNQFSYQISISNPAKFHFSLGLPKEKVKKMKKIEFQILAKKNRSEENLLFSKSYHTDILQLSRDWQEFEVDLSPYIDSNVILTFKNLLTPKKNHKTSPICWGNPLILNTQRKEKERLNIIVYLVDTLRADHIGCYGHPEIKTPNLDKFASEGVLFENAFSQASWTKPSTATLFTSAYPSYHGAITRKDGLSRNLTTIAETLKNNGYLTAGFIHNPNIVADFGFHQGFDSYVDTFQKLKIKRLYAHHMNQLIFPWLEKNATAPFFLYIHTLDPHDPYNPPPPFDTMYDNDYQGSIHGSSRTLVRIDEGKIKVNMRDIQYLEALYNGEITINDLAFGELIKKLKQLKLYDRTLIIFTSDHGEEFWDHQGVKHGDTLYEEQVHIPLIMRYPRCLPPNKRISAMVRTMDIMPTILELLHLPSPSQCQGISLLPLINDKTKSIIKEFYCEEDLDGAVVQAIHGKHWKLIFYPKTGAIELFNLDEDPKEKYNLASQYSELTNSLMSKIKHWHQVQIRSRAGLHRSEVKNLNKETIKQLKALGYLK